MTTPPPDQPRPPEYKTRADGRGGLLRARLVGEPHDGRELFIDELDLPDEIYTTPTADRFEWWPAQLQPDMERLAGGAPGTAPPVRYVLRIPDDTREPLFIAAAEAR
jgi:hypothetical protein